MDYSYSGLIDRIQGDAIIGKDVLVELSNRIIDKQDEIFKMEDALKKLQLEQKMLRAGIDNAMKHLKYTSPLAIKYNDVLIVISDISVTLERNVI
jgi:hypothetical protein